MEFTLDETLQQKLTLKIPSELVELIKEFEQKSGAEFRLVGGCVRDLLLGFEPHDWDMVTTLSPEEIQATFKFEKVGAQFPVFLFHHETLGQIEIASTRSERKVGTGYHGFEVTFVPSFEVDALRRDFTINALSWSPKTPGVVHYYHESALSDLVRKILRANSMDAFVEDPVRMFRMVRFKLKLGFEVCDELKSVARDWRHPIHQEMLALPADRVRKELEAMFVAFPFHQVTNAFAQIYGYDPGGSIKGSILAKWMMPLKSPSQGVFHNYMFTVEECYLLLHLYFMARYPLYHQKFNWMRDVARLGYYSEAEVMRELVGTLKNVAKDPKTFDCEQVYKLCNKMTRGKFDYFFYLNFAQYLVTAGDVTDGRFLTVIKLVGSELSRWKFIEGMTPADVLQSKIALVKNARELVYGQHV